VPDLTFAAVLLLVGLVAVAVWYAGHVDRRRLDASMQRLLERERGMARTAMPCGLTPAQLADSFKATPRGDRRYGLRYGITAPLTVTVDGEEVDAECASFQWWSEDERTETSSNGSRTTYAEQRTPVTVLRLPITVPTRISLTPESLLGRVGLTRGGQQLESSEFNRRFRVDARDRTLSVQLLDARLQTRLTEEFQGRSVEVMGDLLVLGGRPSHSDGSLHGVIGELPAMRQDVKRLLDAVPPQFWRAARRDQEA
jgi:hypothetical protein